MNARAFELVDALLAILTTLPGASALNVDASEIWAFVVITAESDEAVRALGTALGLGAPAVRGTARLWWRYAAAERRHGALHVEVKVLGPRHRNPPPPDDAPRSP
jgi:hypothetical protein